VDNLKKDKMDKIRRPLLFLLMLMVLSACSAMPLSPTPIPTIALERNATGTVAEQNVISASGVVVPLRTARLAFPATGRVKSVAVQVGDVVQAGQPLVQLDTAILEAKVREAEANLAAAQAQVRYLKRLGSDQVHLEAAEAEVARVQALLDLARANLSTQSTLSAPFAGTIVTVDVMPGETVVPGRVVVVLADLSQFLVETTDLSERLVPKVHVGQPATLFIEALGEEVPGKVVDIDRISSTLGGDVVFKVTLAFDTQPAGLRWGMSAAVKIQIAP
jgi:membrane fusion protein (multidrug efflux system)